MITPIRSNERTVTYAEYVYPAPKNEEEAVFIALHIENIYYNATSSEWEPSAVFHKRFERYVERTEDPSNGEITYKFEYNPNAL